MVKTGKFYIKLFMSICTKRNPSHPALVIFLLEFYSHYYKRYTLDMLGSSFFDIVGFLTSKQN